MKRGYFLALFALTVVLGFVLPFVWHGGYGRLGAWLVVAVGVLAAVVGFTPDRGGTLAAVLIDDRNRFSQPALITLTWFVVVISAYLACALWNVAIWQPTPGTPLPIGITVPASVWVLAGIVGTDLVGTGIILEQKRRNRTPSAAVTARVQQAGMTTTGTVLQRASPADARVDDLVTHDEPLASETPDLGAVQKLLFQIAAAIIYTAALGRLIYLTPAADAITAFPEIPEGFLALLGVSTATALVNRAVPRD